MEVNVKKTNILLLVFSSLILMVSIFFATQDTGLPAAKAESAVPRQAAALLSEEKIVDEYLALANVAKQSLDTYQGWVKITTTTIWGEEDIAYYPDLSGPLPTNQYTTESWYYLGEDQYVLESVLITRFENRDTKQEESFVIAFKDGISRALGYEEMYSTVQEMEPYPLSFGVSFETDFIANRHLYDFQRGEARVDGKPCVEFTARTKSAEQANMKAKIEAGELEGVKDAGLNISYCLDPETGFLKQINDVRVDAAGNEHFFMQIQVSDIEFVGQLPAEIAQYLDQ